MDTIFALATATGRAGVSVIRVSGPDAFVSLERISSVKPKPRTASLAKLTDASGQMLDIALVLTFPGPASFTGEDVVEYHTPGSVAIVDAVQMALASVDGHRRAEPGEFTRRALTNGKMDLTQVEGLADLIEAQTEAQRQQAQQTVSGEFTAFVTNLRTDLSRAAALLEAVMDFADEEVPEDVTPEVLGLIAGATTELQRQIDGDRFSERFRSGFEVAIVGAPYVGKSTLLNALAGREASITSVYAGTTLDVIEVQMDLGGIPVTVLDTAGLRETSDHVEKIGIERARERAESADLRVALVEGDQQPDIELHAGDITLLAKCDAVGVSANGISGKTGVGVEQLIAHIKAELSSRVQRAGLATRERHRDDMMRTLSYLEQAQTAILGGPERYDIGAEDLRAALHALNSIIGHVDVENLLDEIFSSFCVGK